MNIRKLNKDEEFPMELLLSADPSRKIVEEYVQRGECFIAEITIEMQKSTIGE